MMEHLEAGVPGQVASSPQRTPTLALLGLVTALAVHFILPDMFDGSETAGQVALALGLAMAAVLVAFTIERRFWLAAILFSVAAGTTGALVTLWNGAPGGWNANEAWRMVSLVLAVAIAAPLFQAARDEGARRFPYPAVHDYAWTNVVQGAAACVFVGIVFLMAWLLAALFNLIGIKLIEHLLEESWFRHALAGLAFGGAVGLLREHDRVVRLLQRVVAMVLAVLAPVLAVGLVLFVLSLPFTGLDALWDATSATTPILLCCMAGALILANAVIGNAAEEERRSPALHYGALALSLVALPLALLAAVATGLRIGQYGYTPERLWGLVFVVLACAYGVAYLGSVLIARRDWTARLRTANLRMALGMLGVALVLATPIVSFNAISTRDQVARLETGRVAPDKFDWEALAFNFGAPGRAALERLRVSHNEAIRTKAVEAAKAEKPWQVERATRRDEMRQEVVTAMRVLPAGKAMPKGLLDALAEAYACVGKARCTLILTGDTEAIFFADSCFTAEPAPVPADEQVAPSVRVAPPRNGCDDGQRYALVRGAWREVGFGPARTGDEMRRARAGYPAGSIEVRTVPRRQVYAGGVPIGQPFE